METKENLVDLDIKSTEQGTSETCLKSENAELSTNVENVQEKTDASASSNNEETGTHQEHVKEALELLYVNFPNAFIKEGDCKPLKVGILEDLKIRVKDIEGLSISKVRAAVRIYTTRLRYLYAVREGIKRVDLDGVEGEAVTAEHAEYARTRFSEINAKRRPAKPKKPQGNRQFNKSGKRPFNKRFDGNGEGHNQNANNGQRRFNNQKQNRNRFNNQNNRRLDPAKASDIKVGRFVFVSTDRSFVKGTVSEELHGDKVSVTLQNGLPVNIPLDRVFIGNNNNRPKGQFDRNNNRNNNRNYNGQGNGQHRYDNRQRNNNHQNNNQGQHRPTNQASTNESNS